MNNFVRINQDDVDYAINKIVGQIRQSKKKYKYIVGIRNGGVHVSQPIAAALNLPHKTVGISCYGNSTIAGEPIIGDDFQWAPDGLLVDDIIDGGKTIETFKSKFGPIDVAVIFWKQESHKPEYYGYKKPNGWLIFPWEVIKQLKK
jgi:hypoxanthine phosphoribosyltransferase